MVIAPGPSSSNRVVSTSPPVPTVPQKGGRFRDELLIIPGKGRKKRGSCIILNYAAPFIRGLLVLVRQKSIFS